MTFIQQRETEHFALCSASLNIRTACERGLISPCYERSDSFSSTNRTSVFHPFYFTSELATDRRTPSPLECQLHLLTFTTLNGVPRLASLLTDSRGEEACGRFSPETAVAVWSTVEDAYRCASADERVRSTSVNRRRRSNPREQTAPGDSPAPGRRRCRKSWSTATSRTTATSRNRWARQSLQHSRNVDRWIQVIQSHFTKRFRCRPAYLGRHFCRHQPFAADVKQKKE